LGSKNNLDYVLKLIAMALSIMRNQENSTQPTN